MMPLSQQADLAPIFRLASLNEREQTIVELSFAEDLDDAEIARRVGGPTEKVRVDRWRAVQKLGHARAFVESLDALPLDCRQSAVARYLGSPASEARLPAPGSPAALALERAQRLLVTAGYAQEIPALGLPEIDAQAALLTHADGLPLDAVAKRLEVDIPAARAALGRAHTAIRDRRFTTALAGLPEKARAAGADGGRLGPEATRILRSGTFIGNADVLTSRHLEAAVLAVRLARVVRDIAVELDLSEGEVRAILNEAQGLTGT